MKLFSIFGKLAVPFFYIGKIKDKNMAYVGFGNGIIFTTRVNSFDAVVLYEIWKNRCYQAAQIKKNDIVVDIGAHIGGYAVWADKLGAKVIAYEPLPSNYQLLLKNIKLNKSENIKSHNVAVSSKTGEITLHVEKRIGLSSIYPSATETITVPSIGLHEIFTSNKFRKISLLKMDVEGAEYDILLHARTEDLQKIETLIIEYHDFFDHGHSKAELKALLQNNGFSVNEVSPWYQGFLLKFGIILATKNV